MAKKPVDSNESEKASSAVEELKIITPLGEVVKLSDGREITVKPYKFLQFIEAISALTLLMSGMVGDELDMIRAFSNNGNEVVSLIGLAIGEKRDFFADLESEDGLNLAMATYRVNEPFFVQKLIPVLKQFQVSTTLPDPELKEPNQNQLTESEQVGSE